MSLRESVGLALTSLRANTMRSLLTLLGVIIGIASVITILTLGQSLKSQTAASLEQAGASDYTVQVQARPDPGTPESEAAGPPVADVIKDPDDRISAEMIAEKWGLSREALDELSLESHRRAARATDDPDAAAEAWHDVERRALRAAVVVPVAQFQVQAVVADRVEGLVHRVDGTVDWAAVRVADGA